MPILRALPWAIWGAMLIFAFATYATLPEMIPQHFDAAGNVTATMPRSPWSWAMIPIIAFVTVAGITVVSAMLPKHPEWFNFNEKKRFLAIPEAYRGPVIARMREMLDVTGTFTVLVFAVVQLMIWRAATGHAPGAMSLGLIVGTVLFTPGILIMLSRVNNAVEDAEKRWKAAEGNARPR